MKIQAPFNQWFQSVFIVIILCFSFIAVVPPTPPPVYEAPSYNRLIHLTEQVKTVIWILLLLF